MGTRPEKVLQDVQHACVVAAGGRAKGTARKRGNAVCGRGRKEEMAAAPQGGRRG